MIVLGCHTAIRGAGRILTIEDIPIHEAAAIDAAKRCESSPLHGSRDARSLASIVSLSLSSQTQVLDADQSNYILRQPNQLRREAAPMRLMRWAVIPRYRAVKYDAMFWAWHRRRWDRGKLRESRSRGRGCFRTTSQSRSSFDDSAWYSSRTQGWRRRLAQQCVMVVMVLPLRLDRDNDRVTDRL